MPLHLLVMVWCVLDYKIKIYQYQHPPSHLSYQKCFVHYVHQSLMVHMKDKGVPKEVVPKLAHCIDHSQGFPFFGVVISLRFCDCLAYILHQLHITIYLLLHECTAECTAEYSV